MGDYERNRVIWGMTTPSKQMSKEGAFVYRGVVTAPWTNDTVLIYQAEAVADSHGFRENGDIPTDYRIKKSVSL